ncbi:MAG TPA: hypothetical protein VGC54_05660 [Planctomycetota bacterium]
MTSLPQNAMASMMIMPRPNEAYGQLSAADQRDDLGAVRKAMTEPVEVTGPMLEQWEGFEIESDASGKINDKILVKAARMLLPAYVKAISMPKLALQDPPAGVLGFEYCYMSGMWVCYHTYQLYDSNRPWVLDSPANKKGINVDMVLQVHWHW